MPLRVAVPSLRDFLTVGDADLVGVSPSTLHLWVGTGKLKPRRPPLKRYRLDRREDLEGPLRSVPAAEGAGLAAARQRNPAGGRG